MKTEIWKLIKDFPNYEVSNRGTIRDIKTKQSPTTLYHKNGAIRVFLKNDTKLKEFFLHHLVVETFMNVDSKNYMIKHKNGDKTDNQLDNLIATIKKNSYTLIKINMNGNYNNEKWR